MLAFAAVFPQSRPGWAAVAIFAVSLLVGLLVSGVSGPAFWELERLRAVARGAELVWNVAEYGPSVFTSSSAHAIYDEAKTFGVLPVITSGWAKLSLARFGVLDELTAQRLAFIIIVATVPASLFLLVERAWGSLVGGVAASLLFAQPRWLHEAGLASEAAVTTACWFLVLAFYFRSLPGEKNSPREARRWAAAAGIALAFAVALSFSVLWVVPCVLGHFALLRPRQLGRTVARGRLPAPAAALWAMGAAPPIVLALVPQLWSGGARSAAAWLLSGVGPRVEPAVYLGESIAGGALPRTYAAAFLLATVPLTVLVLALAGVWSAFARWKSARASHTQAGPSLPLLAILFTVGGLAAVASTPPLLGLFPPRTVAVLPLISAFAAMGVVSLAERWVPPRGRRVSCLGVPVALVAIATISLPSAGASFSWLVGGPSAVMDASMFAVGDGAELEEVARAIDAMGQPTVTLHSPDTPRGYWPIVHDVGRMRTPVVERPDAQWRLTRGASPGGQATVSRAGAALWSLSPR